MSNAEVTHTVCPYPGESTDTHCWTLVIDSETVSELWISIEDGEIMQVETPTAHRRQGYASRLYEAASAVMDVYHAAVTHRTLEGAAFARSVGGDSLPCSRGCCDTDDDHEEYDL